MNDPIMLGVLPDIAVTVNPSNPLSCVFNHLLVIDYAVYLTKERIDGAKMKLSYLPGKIVVVVLFFDGGTHDCARYGGVVEYSGAGTLRATV